MKLFARLVFLLAVVSAAAGCHDDDDGTEATPTPSFTLTATEVPVRTATASPAAPPTRTPTQLPTAAFTSTAVPTMTATAEATATETASASPSVTATSTPTTTPDRSALLAELEENGIGRYLGRPVPSPTGFEGSWQRFDFATSDEGPICIYGSAFRVYVRRSATNNPNVLFYLEGGGACWNNETCWDDTGAKITAEPLAPLDLFPGIFLRNDPTNPFTDWNIVYVPYCDGSVFAGDNIADYEDGRVWHRGLSNLSTGVDVMASLFPEPDKIVVSGSSAGAFGTLSAYGAVRLAYPDTEMLVLNDSGPGIQNPDDHDARNDREANWRLAQFFPDACTLCLGQPIFVYDWAVKRDPTLRIALFSSLQDYVIRDFLNLSPAGYEELLLDISGRVHSRNPERIKRFFVNDDFHTILLGAGIEPGEQIGRPYRALRVDGVLVRDWVYDFVNDGPLWDDIVEQRTPTPTMTPAS